MPALDQVQKILEEREAAVFAREEDVRQLRAELEKDKEAFMRMADMIRNSTMDLPLISAEPIRERKVFGVKDAVSQAVMAIGLSGKRFSSRDVIGHLEKFSKTHVLPFDLEKNRANISAYMGDLKEEKVIELLKGASGRRPAIYKLKGDSTTH